MISPYLHTTLLSQCLVQAYSQLEIFGAKLYRLVKEERIDVKSKVTQPVRCGLAIQIIDYDRDNVSWFPDF